MKKYLLYLFTRRAWIFLSVALICFAPSGMWACDFADPSFARPMEIVASASNQFGIALYKQIAAEKPTENQFMSPYSVFTALAMTSEGSANESLRILTKVLGLPDSPTLQAGVFELGQALGKADAPYALAVANAIWPEKSALLSPEFQAVIAQVYAGACTPLNYAGDPEAARKTINAWVEQKTNDRIKDLLPAGSIGPLTKMVLTNAIFFKGKWQIQFDKALTQPQPFFLADGNEVAAPLMYLPSGDQKLRYAQLPTCQAIELPYHGDDLSMVVLLPAQGKLAPLEASLDAGFWEKLHTSMQAAEVNVWLPRFKMDAGGSIKKQLTALGMGPLFVRANFSRMFLGASSLSISDVFHKGFVEVNEEGTEAAAATAVVIQSDSEISMPDPIYNFRADHPFIFLIQHNASKSILFMGKVMNPIDN
jgi:serpin B